MRRPTVLVGVVLCAPLLAQDRLPFPFDVRSADPARQEVLLTPRLGMLGDLAGRERVTLVGAPLPDGTAVDLVLERIDVARLDLGLRLDGEPVPGLLESLELSLWSGAVAGRPGSDVHLCLSNAGCSGWIQRGDLLTHLLPRRGDDGRFGSGDVLATSEEALARGGERNESTCELLRPPGDERPLAPALPDVPPAASCGPKVCRIAMEGDYQLSLVFADPPAMVAYVTSLLGYVGNRYEIQAGTLLTFPYLNLWTTPDDPWTSQDQGGNCVDVLYELQAAWAGQIPQGCDLGHLISGASLGCGVAWLDVLCNDNYGFAVSGNINGDVAFPVQQQPSNWDFMVVAHELGHNFSAPHTHDWCPPLDECPPQQYWGSCQDETICSSAGTLMSYCHLCPGGTANITTWFHFKSALLMTQAAQACLPDHLFIEGDHPPLLFPGAKPVLYARAQGDGPVSLRYRFQPGPFSSVSMTEVEPGLWAGQLPQVGCGDEVEIYYLLQDADCGQLTDPPGAPSETHRLPVGLPVVVHGEDFEQDTGWTTEVLGASTGFWERGVPVGDESWSYAPLADADGSGSCWLTGNQSGNSDVDGGAVRLTSPPLDLSAGAPHLSWSQWLVLTNSDPATNLTVEVSDDDGATWQQVWRDEVGTGSAWVGLDLDAALLAAAGIHPSPQVRVRITASDALGSIVEAAVDAFSAGVLTCEPLGEAYCGPANLNSSGLPAVLFAAGSEVAAENQVSLAAAQLPAGHLGMFLNSRESGFLPFPPGSKGNLCLGGGIGRHTQDLQLVAPGGWMSLTLDLTAIPTPGGLVAVQPGETWYFQAWFRDQHPGPTSNFTDGVEITFQ